MNDTNAQSNSNARASKWRFRLGVTLAILAVAGGITFLVMRQKNAGAGDHHGGGRFAQNGPMPVSVITVQNGDIDIALNELGTVTPLANVTVRTQIAGQLIQVAFKEGNVVKAGDFLAEIDPRPYQAALAQAQGQLQHDQALLANAQIDLARYTKLQKEDSIARQQVDTQRTLVQQYQGTVQTDNGVVNNAKLNLGFCRIIAPVNGRLGLRQVDPGNYVQTGDANGIVVITQLQPISVIFPVPEDNLPAVMKRVNGGAILPVNALDRAGTTVLDTGNLITIDNQIDPTTGTVKMRAEFNNAGGNLFANQFVNARLLVDTLKNVPVVPSSAIQRGAPGTFVYVVKPDDTVTIQKVTLGPASGDNIAISAGLTPGQVIVSDGADKLKDGAKISIPGAASPATADASSDSDKSDKKDDKSDSSDKGQHHHHRQQQ